MASLKDIRKRLQTTENIKQITKAMEMIAAARLHRVNQKVQQAKPFSLKLQELLENLSISDLNHPLFEKRTGNKKIGLVVVAADRGLCGSYNNNILAASDQFLQTHSKEHVELILVGRKALEYYQIKGKRIKDSWSKWNDKLTAAQIKHFANQLVEWFLNRELDEIWIIYTHYVNTLIRQVRVEKFLNIEKSQTKEIYKSSTDYIFEPNQTEIYAALLPYYCLTKIQTVLNEAYASELSARVVSMKTATQNAEEMIYKLTLTRNKLRQANITREMLEITAGAESLHN